MLFGLTLEDANHVIREAAFRGSLDLVKSLIFHGADVHSEDDWALRFSSMCGQSPQRME